MSTTTVTPPETNGAGPTTEKALPVNSFKAAAPFLRRPFTEKAVKFKVQATWPKDNPTGGLIVAYIDARLVVERLNYVCPHLWFDEYGEPGKTLECRLTVDGITRPDIGEGYNGKGLYSDALKRAGVKFGIGVSLYAIPKIMLSKSDGFLKDIRTGGGKSLALTPQGEERCRAIYAAWLEQHGAETFGAPLDHGDVVDAVGDPDAVDPPAEAVGAQAQRDPDAITKKRATELVTKAIDAGIPSTTLGMQLVVFGVDIPDGMDTKNKAIEAVRALKPDQAGNLDSWIDAAAAKLADQKGDS